MDVDVEEGCGEGLSGAIGSAGLDAEDAAVFDATHGAILGLIVDGSITGLRIDHVDGLWDPPCYLRKLQTALKGDPRFYVVVEKILGRDEPMPGDWPVAGTTGYEFLNALNGVFGAPTFQAT